MTEGNNPEQQPADVPKTWEDLTHTSDWHSAPDTTLARMADMADAVRVGIGIALIVPGGLISGGVESAQDFFKAVADKHRQGVADHGDPDQDNIANKLAEAFFDKPAEIVEEGVQQQRDALDRGETPTPRWPMDRYIHLRNAKYITPGQNDIPLDHVRVLLSQVIGWTVGEFSTA